MLAILGYLMVVIFLYFIITKRLSPFTGLIIVPIIFGLIGGFGLELGPLIMEGIQKSAPTAILILFAILYFGIMIDTGMFDPITKRIVKFAKGDPLKVIVGSALLAGIVGFDGDGTTTIMICVSAFLPLYKRLGINPTILAMLTVMQIGITTLVPWGGPAGRAASVLQLDATDLYLAMLPGMMVSLIYVLFVAYIIGKRERVRLGITDLKIDLGVQEEIASAADTALTEVSDLKRPKLIWINAMLSLAIMVTIVLEWLPAPVLFIFGTALALLINYPSLEDQRKRIADHSSNALAVTVIILAAGIFAGILKGTAMSDAMAQSLVSLIPDSLGAHFPIITAVLSAPVLFFIGPDAFYFGILPILTETASSYGISALQMGVASLYGTSFGFIGPLVGAMYLMAHMTGISLTDIQKHAAKWSLGILLIYIIVGVITGTMTI